MRTKDFKLRIKQHTTTLDFTTAIQDVMRKRNISYQDLATQLNRSRSWVYRLLRKPSSLTFFKAVEVADTLGMSIRVKTK